MICIQKNQRIICLHKIILIFLFCGFDIDFKYENSGYICKSVLNWRQTDN